MEEKTDNRTQMSDFQATVTNMFKVQKTGIKKERKVG